jgi:hypothetical protein
VKITTTPKKALFYDIETLATGFADPRWVPQVITCMAWSWKGSERVKHAAVCDFTDNQMPHLDPEALKEMLDKFFQDAGEADIVIGHNLRRFDQPVLNGACFYAGFPPLGQILVQDTMDFGKIKGVKKGLDNLAVQLEVDLKKLSMNHAEWQVGYREPGWGTIKSRCRSDVRLNKQVYYALEELGWLAPPKMWKP